MNPKLIMFCVGVCIVGTMYSCISSGIWFGSNQTSFINALAGLNAVEIQTLGGISIPQMPTSWLSAMVTMLSWGYPFLDNAAGLIFKMVVLYPCTIGVVVAIWQLFSTFLSGIAGLVRSIIP